MTKPSYALSGWNPWFYLLVHPPFKDVENRPWRLPKHMIGQRIYVHASLKFDLDGLNDIVRRGLITEEQARLACTAPRGAIIGEVTLTGCVTQSQSPWFSGPYGFTLADPVAYDVPIPMKGRLGFWECRSNP